jgi:hypothetical protein
MPLQFTISVEPDEHGVFDGREMARQLIGNAYRVLVPYVSGCPACTDNLFGVIANRTIEEIHQADHAEGGKTRLDVQIMSTRTGEARAAGEKAHFQAASADIARLLREAGAQQHEHERPT